MRWSEDAFALVCTNRRRDGAVVVLADAHMFHRGFEVSVIIFRADIP
jgi:hypothetical protein